MAVIDMYPGLQVTVLVDGTKLTEYDIEATNINSEENHITRYQRSATSSKYIESTSGKSFTIKLEAKKPFDVRVDGKNVWAPGLIKTAYDRDGAWEKAVVGPSQLVEGMRVVQPMLFAELKTTAAEKTAKSVLEIQKKILAHVGEIVVVVTRRRRVSKTPANSVNTAEGADQKLSDSRFHSKLLVKKAQSHAMVLGAGVAIEKDNLAKFKTELVEPKDMFLARFVFIYHSREQLKSLLVIPRSPSSEPQPEVAAAIGPVICQTRTPPYSPVDDAHKRMEELAGAFMQKQREDLNRFMRELSVGAKAGLNGPAAMAKPAVKHEPDIDIKNERVSTPGIKREHPGDDEATLRRKKQKKLKVTTIIDLTEDDEENAIALE